MPKKCIYCKVMLEDALVFDVCRPCGLGVWGEKMYDAILENMEVARESGDLYQGSISEQKSHFSEDKKPTFSIDVENATQLGNSSIVSEAIENLESHAPNYDEAEENIKSASGIGALSKTPEILSTDMETINEQEVEDTNVETIESSYFLGEEDNPNSKQKSFDDLENVDQLNEKVVSEPESFNGGYGF